MSKMAKDLIRYGALLGWGLCMAAAAANVDDLLVSTSMICMAFVFAVLSTGSGQRAVERGLMWIRRVSCFASTAPAG